MRSFEWVRLTMQSLMRHCLAAISVHMRPLEAKPLLSEARLQAVQDGWPYAIIGIDAQGRTVYWSRSAQLLFDLPRSEAMGLTSEALWRCGKQR